MGVAMLFILEGRVFTEIICSLCRYIYYISSANSFILPLGCNPMCWLYFAQTALSVVATGGSFPLAHAYLLSEVLVSAGPYV